MQFDDFGRVSNGQTASFVHMSSSLTDSAKLERHHTSWSPLMAHAPLSNMLLVQLDAAMAITISVQCILVELST